MRVCETNSLNTGGGFNLQRSQRQSAFIYLFCVNSLWPSDSHLGGDSLEVPLKEHEGVHSSTICKNEKKEKKEKKKNSLNAHQYGVIKLIMTSWLLLNLSDGYKGFIISFSLLLCAFDNFSLYEVLKVNYGICIQCTITQPYDLKNLHGNVSKIYSHTVLYERKMV